MTLPFSVHDSAELELNEAADFYDIENTGLGSMLIDEFERAVATIREHPEAAPVILGKARRWRLVRFPYFLIYSVRKHELRVLAVAHQKRRPFYWRGRR
jgi:plasmid stabilization system protein ParE